MEKDSELVAEATFLLYAAKNYQNTQCYDILEFEEDLKRFKYIKRLFNKYIDSGELRERLILNHIISLNNVFGVKATTKMLFFKLENYEHLLTPFLDLLGVTPSEVMGVGLNNRTVVTADIARDPETVERLLLI